MTNTQDHSTRLQTTTQSQPKFCEAQGGGCIRDPLLPSVPSPPSYFPSLPFHFLLLEVGTLNAARGLGSAVSSPNGVWERAPAEIEFDAFYPYNMTFGGSNFTNFPESLWV